MVRGLGRLRGQRGAVAVEFALVLPLLLLLVLGGIDWGYYFFVSEIAANAAREGARAGALSRAADPCAGDSAATPPVVGAIYVAQNYMVAGSLVGSTSDARIKPFDPSCPATGAPTNGHSCCAMGTTFIPGFPDPVVKLTLRFEVRSGSMSLTGFLPSWLLPPAVIATATMRREP